jgi:hypothetical protein
MTLIDVAAGLFIVIVSLEFCAGSARGSHLIRRRIRERSKAIRRSPTCAPSGGASANWGSASFNRRGMGATTPGDGRSPAGAASPAPRRTTETAEILPRSN